MHKASTFLRSLSSQPPTPTPLWPWTNTQCWPVTHNAETQCQVTLQDLLKRPQQWRHPHCPLDYSVERWQLSVNISPLPDFFFFPQTNWQISNEKPIAATWIMVMSFRMVSEAVSAFNVLRKLRLWREISVQRFCPSTWALLAVGKTQHHTDIALSDSMGFSFSPSQCLVCGSYDRATGMSGRVLNEWDVWRRRWQ